MTHGAYRFDRFVLDPRDRRLSHDGAAVELNARYFDALCLLVREHGRLVTKDRFLDEVWSGVPVTEEALTQCVRTLRRLLGDDAGRPRFIETVPKHGYRFIAAVSGADLDETAPETVIGSAVTAAARPWDVFFRLGRAGMVGGGGAGLLGGVVYGFAGVSDAGPSSGGATSAVLVIACLTMAVGLLGGAGVGFGVAGAVFASGRRGLWNVIGGAGGGMVVGAVVKLIGLDAFTLLFGQAPTGITGAAEGALLGGAVGLAVWLAGRPGVSVRRGAVIGGLVTAAAGAAIPWLGGRLMGGSLDLLATRFTQSRLRLDHLGALFGETRFGPVSQSVTAGLEGLLFGACVVAAVLTVRHRIRA